MKDSYVFYKSYHEALKHLPDKEFKELTIAINEYALYCKEPKLDGMLHALFSLIKPTLDASIKRYEKAVSNANKRWNGVTSKNDDATAMLQECYSDATSMLPQCYDDATGMLQECYSDATAMLNVNVNDNVNVNVNDDVNANENANENADNKENKEKKEKEKKESFLKSFENPNDFRFDNSQTIENKEVKEKKEKSSAKKEKKESDNELHHAIIKEYNDWYVWKFGVKPIINGADGKAVKTIINALTPQSGIVTPDDILNSFRHVVMSYSRWDKFHQRNVRLYQIANNLPNIIVKLRENQINNLNFEL